MIFRASLGNFLSKFEVSPVFSLCEISQLIFGPLLHLLCDLHLFRAAFTEMKTSKTAILGKADTVLCL